MADQIILAPVKSASLRRTRASESASFADNWLMAQNEGHLLQGENAANTQQFASLLQFSLTGIPAGTKILGAYLHVFTATDHSGFPPQNVATNLRLAPKTASWASTGGGEGVWTGAAPNKVTDYNATYDITARVSAANLAESVINLMGMVRLWAPKTTKDLNGAANKGSPNYGMVLLMAGTDAAHKSRTSLASDHHVNVGIHPFLLLNVEYPGGPGQTFTSEPNGDIPNGTPLIFKGTYEPGRPGDTIKTVDIKRMGGGLADKTWTITPTASDIGASSFAVQLPESLPSQTAFTWAARVATSRSTPSAPDLTPWSAALPVRLTGTPPVLTALEPDGATIDSLLSVPFKAQVTVPVGGYRTERWRIQLREETSPTDPSWGDAVLWDSGPMVVPLTPSERDKVVGTAVTQFLSTPYGGPALAASTNYSWRVQASDIFGATSPWMYADFTLTVPYVPAPGEVVNLTGYAKRPPFRIRIFGMGALRGPGKLLAELTDAAYVGASEFYNSAGEFFFTLPATHPQVSVIEPYNAHYALEQHLGDGWVGKAFGLITDFDATEDEVIFYGTDYIGLLARSVEERFDPNDAEKTTDKGGGKYVKKTISAIVLDQLTQAKAKANSPVGFIVVGPIAAMPEQVTIYSSFKQRLPFIAGLLDSARAGTGRRTRLVCEKLPNGTFRWRVILEPGVDRKNLRMEYGGLVQGFRTVPFGGWGSAVAAIGRTVLGTKVYSALSVAPGVDETIYGHWPSLATYSDIDDLNDLRRRAAQAATRGAKVGKQMGLGLRVGSIGVKDGWDITDSVPVDIDRGVVDTSRFGSGFWTIWGWTWHSFPDGHDALTLSLAPREDTTGLPTPGDLIPSSPILMDWQTGHGAPTTWGVPPTPAPPALFFSRSGGEFTVEAMDAAVTTDGVVAKHYEDLDTGCTYELDETTDEYVLIACPSDGDGGTPYVPDIIPPPVITIKEPIVALEATQQDDGSIASALQGTIGYDTPPAGLVDLAEVTVQSTRYAVGGVPDWTRATIWTVPSADFTGTLDTIVVQPNALSGETYYWRATATDRYGNRQQTWSNVAVVVAASDLDGPPQVTGIVVKPGMNTLGVRWDAVLAADFAYSEVQVRESPDGTWVSAQTGGTMVVLTGLTNDLLHDIRIRSVDTTGNVKNADGSNGLASDPDAGWAPIVQGTPVALPGSALVWDEADIEAVFAGMIDADWITTGTLHVGVGAGKADAIEVFDSTGHLIGTWSSDGITLTNPANPGYKMVLDEEGLVIYEHADTAPSPVVTMGPLGIDAASIRFGSARGGHNLIQNSSFELGAFGTSADVPNTWDVLADWNATRVGADTNVTTGATSITMTAI